MHFLVQKTENPEALRRAALPPRPADGDVPVQLYTIRFVSRRDYPQGITVPTGIKIAEAAELSSAGNWEERRGERARNCGSTVCNRAPQLANTCSLGTLAA